MSTRERALLILAALGMVSALVMPAVAEYGAHDDVRAVVAAVNTATPRPTVTPQPTPTIVTLDAIADPAGNGEIVMGARTLTLTYTNPAGGWLFNETGNGSAHFVEVNQNTGNVPAGFHALHVEAEDTDATALHATHDNNAGKALMVDNGIVDFTTADAVNFAADAISDAEVSNTLTCSDLVAGGSVVADSEVDDNITASNYVLKSGETASVVFGDSAARKALDFAALDTAGNWTGIDFSGAAGFNDGSDNYIYISASSYWNGLGSLQASTISSSGSIGAGTYLSGTTGYLSTTGLPINPAQASRAAYGAQGISYEGDVNDNDELVIDWFTGFDAYDVAGDQGDKTVTVQAVTGTVPVLTGAETAASTGDGTVKMGSANPATNAGWLALTKSDGTTVYVPYWTSATP